MGGLILYYINEQVLVTFINAVGFLQTANKADYLPLFKLNFCLYMRLFSIQEIVFTCLKKGCLLNASVMACVSFFPLKLASLY